MASLLKRIVAGGFALAFALVATTSAQNITTAVVNGAVTDSAGAPISGASVTATHVPSGTKSTAITNAEGRYSLRGLVVGGPFTITAKAPGQDEIAVSGVTTQLGSDTDVNLRASANVVQMADFTVTGSQNDLDSGMTGTGSTLDNRRMLAQPTVSRSFGDLIRVNPFAAFRTENRVIALGQNNRYNSISVDGARINDQYGLSGSGLASFRNPMSVDTIEQISVSLAPYDVRQSGFTGAEINAVTKRGTNTLSGTGYYIYTDGKRQGPDKFGTTAGTRSLFYQRTSGATLGGPLLPNRLFFFANYERFTEDSVASNPAFTPDATTVASVLARVKVLTTTDMGTFGGGGTVRQTDTKRLLKLDWNIIAGHRATWRYSDTKGTNPSFGNLNVTSYSVAQAATSIATPSGITALPSNFYVENRVEKVMTAQVVSDWTPALKTQLNYAKSSFDDPTIPAVNFPSIRIFGFPGVSPSGATISNGSLNFGTNESRQGNAVQTRSESYSANGDYTWREFTLSGGVDHEKTFFSNLFRPGSFGVFDYTTPTDFINDNVRGFTRAIVQTGTPIAEASDFKQIGYFGQVKWDATKQLNLTAGVREDEIGVPTKVLANTAFATAFGVPNTATPDGTKFMATRFSFNYALDRERTTQVRGGIGEFLGRAPWVYISNSYGNSGVGRYSDIRTATTTPKAPTLASFLATDFDPNNPIGTAATDPGTGTRAINLMLPGTRLPTIRRWNLALDHKLSFLSANVSAEYIRTDNLNSFFVENLNISKTTVGADGRQRFGGSATTAPRVAGYAAVFAARSIHGGNSDYFGVSLDRPMKNSWAYNLSYTHGRALEAQSFGSSTASSNWGFVAVFNQNVPELAHGDYEMRDRIQASLTKEFHWGPNLLTSASLYYEGHSGNAYSWVYTNDMNGDGQTANDLIAIPTGLGDTRFDFSGMTATEQAAYFDFINKYGLSRFAGGYVPRNAFNQPWQNRLDLHFSQNIPLHGRVQLELFMDFINFGSLISRELFSYIEELPSATNTGQVRQFGSATYTAAGLVKPTITIDANSNATFPTASVIRVDNFDTRWKMQFGTKIKF